jgi:hypothetical protein
MMVLATRSAMDIADSPTISDLSVEIGVDIDQMALLGGVTREIVGGRIKAGNTPHVAYLNGDAIAIAWAASDLGHLGEFGLSFWLPSEERFLWEFQFLRYGGPTLYADLLQQMVLHEDASRFWLAYDPEDARASAAVTAAGFRDAAKVSYRPGRGVVLVSAGCPGLAAAASVITRAPLADLSAAVHQRHDRVLMRQAPQRRAIAGRSMQLAGLAEVRAL